MMFKLKSGPVGWMTILLVKIRSRLDGQNRGSLLGGDKTGSNHHLLSHGLIERKKIRKKDIRNIPEVEKESDFIESKEETIVKKEIC